MDKTIKYERACQRNKEYPKVRLVCGCFEYILKKGDVPVRVEKPRKSLAA